MTEKAANYTEKRRRPTNARADNATTGQLPSGTLTMEESTINIGPSGPVTVTSSGMDPTGQQPRALRHTSTHLNATGLLPGEYCSQSLTGPLPQARAHPNATGPLPGVTSNQSLTGPLPQVHAETPMTTAATGLLPRDEGRGDPGVIAEIRKLTESFVSLRETVLQQQEELNALKQAQATGLAPIATQPAAETAQVQQSLTATPSAPSIQPT